MLLQSNSFFTTASLFFPLSMFHHRTKSEEQQLNLCCVEKTVTMKQLRRFHSIHLILSRHAVLNARFWQLACPFLRVHSTGVGIRWLHAND